MTLFKRYCGPVAAMICSFSCVADESGSHHGIDHEKHPHHFSVLLANTDMDEHGNGFTLGLDYEYRVSDTLGLGAVVEYAASDLEAWTALAVADIHITPQMIMQVGPGFERTPHHRLFVARIGALYEFEFDGWTLSPQLHFDYHDGGDNAVVYGLAFGKSF